MRVTNRTKVRTPPLRHGHYSDDGAWWWEESRGQWLRATLPVDTLEIELENHGQSTTFRSILTTLSGQYGTQSYRFVGRARSDDPRWLRYDVPSDTFPVLPTQPLEPLGPRDASANDIRGALRDLETSLDAQGWRFVGTGDHWWSKRYTRPAVDWDTPADAYASES